MSKSFDFPNEIILDSYVLRQDKDCDGRIQSVGMTIDPDYNKEDIEIIESCNSYYMLRYNDRSANYYLNYCEGSYFCNESDL